MSEYTQQPFNENELTENELKNSTTNETTNETTHTFVSESPSTPNNTQNGQAFVKKTTKKSPFLSSVFGGIIGASVVLCSFYVVQQLTPQQKNNALQQPNNAQTTVITPLTKEDATVFQALNNVQNAVVSIANYQTQNSYFFFKNASNELKKVGEGSGVIYKSENGYAYVVTNNHVIADAKELNVQFKDGTSVSAQLVGTDVLTDLAVLKIKNDHVSTVATFANSDNVQTGQTVLAIGSPLGSELASSVTKGIVSAAHRAIELDTNNDDVNDWTMEAIQTDAAINPGNSGGALVDLNGHLIGINTLKIVKTTVEGIGFAIPSNQVTHIINALEKDGEVKRPVLGIQLIDLNDISVSQRKAVLLLDETISTGVVVSKVQPFSNAERAGIKEHDVIIRMNNEPITNSMTLRKALYNITIGQNVSVDYYRNGKQETTTITLNP